MGINLTRKFFLFLFLFHLADANDHRNLWKEAVQNAPPYCHEKYQGQGVVMCAGNPIYLVNAWIHLNFLRSTQCKLPVELWYYGEEEICPVFIELFRTIDVECRDLKPFYPHLEMGYQFKPFAIAASSFQEVLLLDADNFPITDPTPLFQWTEYQEYGAVFWPDLHYITPHNPIWKILEIDPSYLPWVAQESGQLLINKKRCWLPLQLTLHFNEHYKFYYQYLWGDKDTYQFAWQTLRTPFFMISYFPALHVKITKSFIQRDPKGGLLFYHLNERKWSNIFDPYKLASTFVLPNHHEYPSCCLMGKFNKCLFPNGEAAKLKNCINYIVFDRQFETMGNIYLQQVLDNPELSAWIKKNKDKVTKGNIEFDFANYV